MKININPALKTPLYTQLINFFETAIADGRLKEGDALPSMNELSRASNISMETVKKAYNILKDRGLLDSRQGKGFYITVKDPNAPKKILLLFDKLSTYKLTVYRSFINNLDAAADITIHLHNQDIEMFEKLVEEAVDNYDYYLVTPHFSLDTPSLRIRKAVSKIPNKKLIILDKEVEGFHGNIGSLTQDFANDAYNGLKQGVSLMRKYKEVCVICSEGGMYSDKIVDGIKNLLWEEKIPFRIYRNVNQKMIVRGSLFIILGGQLDTDHFNVLKTAREKDLKLGKDVGIVVYNDAPVNEFIADGLTCLSTDFAGMGKKAAEMVNTGKMIQGHNDFNLVIRKSL